MSHECLWKPESIRVFAGEGKPSIEIIGYLKDPDHPHSALMGTRKRLEFPADVYPPDEASKSLIEDAVIHAAATVNVHLTKQGTVRKKKGFTTILGCDMRKTYYAPKDSSDIQKRVYEDMDSDEQPSVKDGIKHDNFINKRAAQRPKGKSGAKRTYTTKPAPNQPVRLTCAFAWILESAGICPHGPVMSTTTIRNWAPATSVDAWQRFRNSNNFRPVSIPVTERVAKLPEFCTH